MQAAKAAVVGASGVEAVTAAAAQIQLEEDEPEPGEPDPEPEPLPGEEEGGAVPLACSHTFHALCLERWKEKSLEKAVPYTCAMCRAVAVVATPAKV